MSDRQRLERIEQSLHAMETIGREARALVNVMLDDSPEPAPEPADSLAPLFDLIGMAESRGRGFPQGNYNAYYGRAGNTSRPRLTEMTLSEVLDWQQRRIKADKFSAAGRYQIIRKTLLGLIRKHNIRGELLFDEMVQNMLCVHLLRGRGLDRFLRGNLTVTKFGNALAREWAGLPMLSGRKAGRSYYDGDGVNAATVTTDQVRAALKAVRRV